MCHFLCLVNPKFEITIPKHTKSENPRTMRRKAQTFSLSSSSMFSLFFLICIFLHLSPITSTPKPRFFLFLWVVYLYGLCIDRNCPFPCEKLDMRLRLHLSLVCNFLKTFFFFFKFEWHIITYYKPINSHQFVISYILIYLLLVYCQCNCKLKNA